MLTVVLPSITILAFAKYELASASIAPSVLCKEETVNPVPSTKVCKIEPALLNRVPVASIITLVVPLPT